MRDRLPGLLLFLPVPIVLALFTRAPLGTVPSILLGIALVATHRLYARPFALGRAPRRCLWCGGVVGESAAAFAVEEPGGRTEWRVCRSGHLEKVARVLGWADRARVFLRVGILGTLGLFLAVAILSASRRFAILPFGTASALFRIGIALTVLPLGWLSLRGDAPPDGAIRSPFPLHVPALPGLVVVLWLFRLVGVWWLVEGGWNLLGAG
jgi:hypothetical protein